MAEISPYLELLKKTLTGAIYDESAWEIEGVLERNRSVSGEVRGMLRRVAGVHRGGQKVVVRKKEPDAVHEGKSWPLFGYSMIGMKRMDHLHACLDRVVAEGVPGDFLEAGVWRGGAVIFMRAFLQEHGITDRVVWAADSFEGLPAPTLRDKQTTDPDVSGEPFLMVPLEEVRKNFSRFGLLDERTRFLPGWFSETLPAAPVGGLALLRVDADMYSSTKDVLEALYPKVSPGGFVIIDDYFSWQGCREAVEEYRAAHRIDAPMEKIDWTAVCWRKPT